MTTKKRNDDMTNLSSDGLRTVLLHAPDRGGWLWFRQPVRVLRAMRVEEVLPLLESVEAAVAGGYYAAGFVGYEASPAFDSALVAHAPGRFPLAVFGIFEAPERWAELPESGPVKGVEFALPFSREAYENRLARIREHIQKGDTYQVNFTFRMMARCTDDPFDLFLNVARHARYGAWVDMDDFAVCSASPELFFFLENETLTTRPMKGTAPRGRTTDEDLFYQNQLRQSAKDRAENVMIVDMIRNDLGKIAEVGTVRTPRLFEVEKHPTVWQMTTTVEARTRAGLTDILKALFPCASVTGAPKVRTMRLIRALEETPRNLYCGTIGFVEPGGNMQFNVAIRTALFDRKNQTLEYGTGGGITWYSDPKKEFEECFWKAKIMRQPPRKPDFALLETLLWEPASGWFLPEKHLARLARSATYFGVKVESDKWEKALRDFAQTFDNQSVKVRFLVSLNGEIRFEKAPLPVSPAIRKVALARLPIDAADPFLFHKTTRREVYEKAKADFPDYYDVLLWNEKGELTEGTFHNLVVEWRGEWLTPPVECGLLAGVYRAHLLETGVIREAALPKEILAEATGIYLINSVRKWQKAAWVPQPSDAFVVR
ncbi:MAG: aminodeoxychorismate synthase component I [Bacteroidetes bacterium]|nr:MAG: aminodeoxychorismate synthase component I [Bacteroidota bacterium]